uniref:HtaA domain-containing protein n=1 Tax=Streptomyces sp. CRN 30 TaxID=3075613 RepID=UPI002A83462D
MPTGRRRPRSLAAAVATAAALGATALTTLTASPAAAADVPLSDYSLTWGIKQSYRTYVATFAQGTFTPADGAAQADGNGAFTFTGGEGAYDSTAHTVALAFRGSLAIESEAHGFALTLSDVTFDSEDAEITADVTRDGTTTEDVPLATVDVTRDMKEMATTLTDEAADVFGSASYAGAAGDPLTVTAPATPTPTATPTTDAPTTGPTDPATQAPEPTVSATAPAPSGSTSPSAAPSPVKTDEDAPARGDIADGTLGWGVKESFRGYVVGSVAKGKITVSDGASQAAGNGAFTFTGASGTYDTEAGTLTASFEGAVNFKGHEGAGEDGGYGLDLTLAGLTATLDGGSGELTADVTSLGEKTEDVVLADLKADSAGLTAKDDVIDVDDVTATLTEAGAKAFGGFYEAGAALDPVELTVALTDDAQLPEGGSAGTPAATTGASGTTGSGTGSTSGATGTTGVTGGSLASTGSDVPAPALGAAAAVAV